MAVDSSKTEKATPKKRQDERKKGNLFKSQDVISAVSVLSVFLTLKLTFPSIYDRLSLTLAEHIAYSATMDELTTGNAVVLLGNALLVVALATGPVVAVAVVVAILSSGVQTRFRFSKELLKFKFSRLNPIEGFKRLLSMRSIIELIKATLKITVIVVVLMASYRSVYDQFIELMMRDIRQAVGFILNTIIDIVFKLSLAFSAIAALDYLYQWWEYERNLRMTKQEIKEEYKQLEGDPQIKGRIKERQRGMAQRRMMQKVPTADVVIRNPTHYAIALRYNLKKDRAPIVVAKGQDSLALRIVAVAEQYHIPTTENKPLAHALYEAVEVDCEIPPEFYTALAEILAWVYSLKKETGAP